MYIMFNGQRQLSSVSGISVHDRGWLLADGCFETMRLIDGRLCWPELHFQRLAHGLHTLRIPLVFNCGDLQAWSTELCEANQIVNGIARLQVSRGVQAQRGLVQSNDRHPTVVLTLTDSQWVQSARSVRVTIANTIRRNSRSPFTQFKAMAQYAEQIVAAYEAHQVGYDDALIMNIHDQLVCSTVANLWFLRGHTVWTAPQDAGALPGTVRHWLLNQLVAQGFQVLEQVWPNSDLSTVDELWLTNIGMGIGWVSAVQDGPVFNAAPVAQSMHSMLTDYLFSEARVV